MPEKKQIPCTGARFEKRKEPMSVFGKISMPDLSIFKCTSYSVSETISRKSTQSSVISRTSKKEEKASFCHSSKIFFSSKESGISLRRTFKIDSFFRVSPKSKKLSIRDCNSKKFFSSSK